MNLKPQVFDYFFHRKPCSLHFPQLEQRQIWITLPKEIEPWEQPFVKISKSRTGNYWENQSCKNLTTFRTPRDKPPIPLRYFTYIIHPIDCPGRTGHSFQTHIKVCLTLSDMAFQEMIKSCSFIISYVTVNEL